MERSQDTIVIGDPPKRSPPAGTITVLFVIHSLSGGGAERVIVHLVNHLDRRRFTPVLALGAAEGPYLDDLREDVPVHVLGARRARSAIPAVLAAVWRLRPDVVLATAGMNLAVAITRALYPRGTRAILREANSPSAFLNEVRRSSASRALLYRIAYRVLYRQADAVVCQSQFMVGNLARLGVPRSRLSCIYNPIDIARVRALGGAGAGAAFGPASRPRLVTVGRLAHQKGYDVLIRALGQVRRAHPQVSLRIFGDGEERERLERDVRRLGLGGTVELMGFHANPYPAIADADLFVSASRYEGFSNAIAEALACGTPVVATDCPSANREVLEEGVNGWLARGEDPGSLAETICRALEASGAVKRAEIRDRCESQFAAEHTLARYEALLARCAAASS